MKKTFKKDSDNVPTSRFNGIRYFSVSKKNIRSLILIKKYIAYIIEFMSRCLSIKKLFYNRYMITIAYSNFYFNQILLV